MAPMTDPMKPTVCKLCTFSVWYFHRLSRKPPMKEPAMPTTIVPMTPMGSWPGRRRRARAPAISPMMTIQIMKVITFMKVPVLRVLCLCFKAFSVSGLAGQFPFQRRAEPGLEPRAGPDPLGEPPGLGCYGRGGLGPDVLEQPDRDLAVLALGPAADDPAVPPGRRADVPGPVEQYGRVLTDVPGPVAPAHRGGVEGGQQRRPRFGGYRFVQGRLVGGQHDALGPAQVYLDDLQLIQRLPDLPARPAGPPLQVRRPDRAEPEQPPAGQLGPRGGGRRPRLVPGGEPGELAGGPSAARAAAHDETFGRQQREQPGSDV